MSWILKRIQVVLIFPLLIYSCNNKSTEEMQEDNTYELVWSDEFDYLGAPDSTKWSYDLGDGCPNICGWGNNELQYYTSDYKNVRVKDDRLIIEAHKDSGDSLKPYSSTRLLSKNKGDWKYGKIEVKAKIPSGRGTWSAIWMLPTDWQYGGWPKSGEIDIMEHVGFDQGNIHGTVHTEAYNGSRGTQKGDSILVESASDEFVVYAIKWTPDSIEFVVNGEIYNIFTNEGSGFEAWPFDQKFHLLLNVAVGGNWGGREGVDDAIWPRKMEVDYVRIYEKN